MQKTKIHAIVFFLYLAFFFALFLQFPLKNALWGNYDSWITIIIWKSQLARLSSIFSGEFLGTFFYPSQNTAYYGETLFASTAVFGLLKLLGLNDLWACNMMIVFIFAGSAWGVYILAGNYVQDAWPAFFAGFAYTCSNLLLAVMDDTSLVFFMLPPLTIHFFLKFVRTSDVNHLKWTAVLGGLQAYFSLYTFVLQSLMLLVVALVHIRAWAKRDVFRKILPFVAIYCAVAIPLFIFYMYARFTANIYFPWASPLVMDGTTLHFSSLFGVLKNNLIYPSANTDLIFWAELRVLAFMGFGVWMLAFVSLGRKAFSKADLVCLAIVGAAFSFAVKTVHVGSNIYELPFYYTSQDSILDFFRVPSRFFWITSMAVSVMAAAGLQQIGHKLKSPPAAKILVLAAITLHFFENTPFPLRAYPFEPFGKIPPVYKEFFEDKSRQVIIDLPSTDIAIVPFQDDDLFGFNRDVIYMNWQLEHKQHILNGVNSYIPTFRALFEKLVDETFYEGRTETFEQLRKYGVTHIVFHKNLVLEKDIGLENRVKAMPFLELVRHDDNTLIYKVTPPLSKNDTFSN